MKLHKSSIQTLFLFILSPFSSIPFILIQLYRKIDTYIPLLISILFGFLSFRYLPSSTNDKTVYLYRHELFRSYDFRGFIDYLNETIRPDFVFDFINFLFAKGGFNINYFFFLITFFTVFSVFLFVKKVIEFFSESIFYYNISFSILVILAFSLPGLFSGMRFIFAGSIFIWGLYFLFLKRHKNRCVPIFIVSILTHFSYFIFVFPILLVSVWPKNLNPKIVLVSSFVFFFLPKEYFNNISNYFAFSEGYLNKIDLYTNREVQRSENALILTYIRNLWLYVAYLFFLTKKRYTNDIVYLILIFFISAVNFTFPIGTAFNRYKVFLQVIFVCYLIYNRHSRKIKPSTFWLFFVLLFLGTFVDIYILRNNFLASYSLFDMFSVFQILSKKITLTDVLP